MVIGLEELPMEALKKEIKRREALNKKAPKLRKQKAKLEMQLEAINQELARIAQATLAGDGSDSDSTGGMSRTPGGRLPRGAMQEAVLEALAKGPKSPVAIAEFISAGKIPGVDNKSVSMALNKMKKDGKVEAVGRGLYKAR